MTGQCSKWAPLFLLVSFFVFVSGNVNLGQLELFRLRTTSDADYQVWVTTERTELSFHVLACFTARITLSHQPYDILDDSVVEVEISSEDGDTYVRRANDGEILHTESTGPLLDCTNFVQFRLLWENEEIKLESNGITFLNYSQTFRQKAIRAIAFSSGGDTEGIWEYPKDAVRTTLLQSPSEQSKPALISQKSQSDLVFAVKQGSDAQLGLMTSFDEDEDAAYTIVIGGVGNSQTSIQKGVEEPFEVETTGILSDKEYRYFWVRWTGGIFSIGRGKTVGSRTFLNWLDHDHIPELTAVSVFGSLTGISGTWRLEQAQYDMLALESGPDDDNYNHWLNIGYRKVFQFEVRACSAAVIKLLPKAQIEEQAEIATIQLSENGSEVNLTIFDPSGNKSMSTTVYAATGISCNSFAPLWVSWFNSHFKLGTGRDYEKNVLFDVEDLYPGRITTALQLSSQGTGKVDWVFDRHEAKQTIFVTPPHKATGELTEAWMTIGDQRSLTIGVQACSEAVVVLASYLHIPDSSSYKITLGAKDNTEAVIEKTDTDDRVVSPARDALSCASISNLWISWNGKVISAGVGKVVGYNTLVSLVDNAPYDIQAAAFGANPADHNLTHWYLGDMDGEYYKFSSTRQRGRVWLAVAHSSVFFQVRSNDTIRVTLSSAFGKVIEETAYFLVVEDGPEKITSLSVGYEPNENVLVSGKSFLSETDFIDMWISISADGVHFGLGTVNEESILHLKQDNDSITPISGIMLSSDDDDAEWVISKELASVVEYNTMAYRNHGQMWMTTGAEKNIVFKVRADAQAWILLSSQVENVDVGVFEIGIGVIKNTYTQIRQNLYNSVLLQEVETPRLLSASEMRPFWISWDNKRIQVGQGPYVGENVLVSWNSPVDLAFHGVSPSTEFLYEGFWEFLQFEDNTYVLTTGGQDDLLYPGNALMTARDQVFNFQLQACDHVLIHYLSLYNDDDLPTYILDIGSDGNSEIKASSPFIEGNETVHYPGVLDCSELRPFWTRVNPDGVLEVGLGMYPNSLLLAFGPVEDRSSSDIAFLKAPDTEGLAYWHVQEKNVQTMEITTSRKEDYNQFHVLVPWMTSYSFQVMACSDVHIILVRIPGKTVTDSYEIRLSYDGSDSVEILKAGQVMKSVNGKTDLLNCFEYRYFWVSWENGLIAVGEGYRSDSARMIQWQDASPHSILAVHVSTANETTGRWQFSQPQGNIYQVKTDAQNNYTTSWLVTSPDVHHLPFRLTQCEDSFSIAYSPSLRYKDIALELVFTPWDNRDLKVQLKDGINGSVLAEASISHGFFCSSPLDLYVSWSQGEFTFGIGNLHSSQKIHLEIPDLKIMSLFLRSEGTTQWQFYEDRISGLRVTANITDADRIWISSNGRTSQVLDIKAESDSNILLGTQLGNTAYQIQLLASSTNLSSIINVNTGNNVSVETPLLFSETGYQTIWVSWKFKSVAFGRGPVVGENEVLHMNDTEGYHIGAVGLSSELHADWMVFREQSKTYKIKPSRDLHESQWYFVNDTTEQMTISFQVKACDAARIRFVSATNDWVHDSYDILIGGDGDTRSFILSSASQEILVAEETPSYLKCGEFRRFWLSWNNDIIEVGSGEYPNHVFITYSLPHTVVNPGIKFFRNEGASEWEIPQQEGGTLWTYTNDLSYRATWISLQGLRQTTFSVKACADAHVVLTPVPGVYTMDEYAIEVILGHEDNTAIVVKLLSGNELGRLNSSGILSCNNWRQFSLMWTDESLIIGRGLEIDEPSRFDILTVQWEDALPLNALSFGSQSDAEWLHGQLNDAEVPEIIPDDFYIFYTKSTMVGRTFGLSTDSFGFSVMACKDASVTLKATEDESLSGYVITFGVDGENVTKILKHGEDGLEETFDTPGILDCNKMMPFWLQWSLAANYLRVGSGNIIGAHEIGRIDDNVNPSAKNFIAFSTIGEFPARWQIYQTSVHSMTARTGTEFSYDQVWVTTRSRNWQVFQVQACNDAHILLSSSPENEDNVYEIALGIQDNQASAMRRSVQGGNEASILTPDILHCNQSETFWVRWLPEVIEVGYGRIFGEKRFIWLVDTPIARSITALSISTGWTSDGVWRMTSITDPTFTIQTGSSREHRAVLHTAHQFVSFRVEGCDEALLHLSSSSYDYGHGYDVILGAENNQKIIIIEVSSNSTTEYAAPDLLACNTFRPFWFSWHDHEFAIGRGDYLSQLLYTYTASSVLNFHYITFSSQNKEDFVTWEIPKSDSKSMVVTTNALDAERNWLTVPFTMYVNFKVRACSSYARLVLQQAVGSDVGIPTPGTITVILNRTSHIMVDTESKATYEGEVIDCHYGNWFWVRWSPMEVTVGHSPEVGNSVIMTWMSESPLPTIEAVEFDTPDGNGTWEFLDIEDGMFTVVSGPDESEERVWLAMFQEHFSFAVQACGEAVICMSDSPGTCSVKVTLGEESNSVSSISWEGNYVKVSTPDILDCRESRPFWINWEKQEGLKVEVGYGAVFEGEPFLQGVVEHLFEISSVSLKTGGNYIGTWQFKDESALSARFFIPAGESSELVLYHLASTPFLVFSVQACSDAVVYLYDYSHDVKFSYSVVLGGDNNNQTWITSGAVQAAAYTPDILSCEERRWFWLSWEHRGLVTFGLGERLHVSEILKFEDSEPRSASYISFASLYHNSEWDVPHLTEETFIISTSGLLPNGREIHVILSEKQKYYDFGVRACESAKVILTSGQSASPVLELELGNTFTRLFQDSNLLTQAMTPGMLDCNENRVFYINWNDNIFELSLRSRDGRNVFTYSKEVNGSVPWQIHGITINTTIEAQWSFERNSGKSFRYIYPKMDDPKYDMLWQSVYGKDYVIFNVKACNEVRILLTNMIGVANTKALEVALNTDNFGRCEIRHFETKPPLTWKDVPDLLSCESFRTFWISWKDGIIKAGTGALVGQQQILADTFDRGIRIVGVSYMAIDSGDAVFEFGIDEGNVYHANVTGNTYDSIMVIPKDEALRFSIASCSAANVLLMSVPGDISEPVYELAIKSGPNVKTELRLGIEGTLLNSVETPGILSCGQPQDFWVSWTERKLGFGLNSNINEQPLLSYEDGEIFDIHGVQVSSGSQTSAQWSWLVEDQQLVRYSLREEENTRDHFWITVSGYSLLVFSVRSCQDVQLVLAEVTQNANFTNTEVVIGEGNLRSYIRSFDGNLHDEQDTPGVLDCFNFKTFWIRWEVGHISVGHGVYPDLNEFLSASDTAPHQIQSIAFSTTSAIDSDFSFDGIFGKAFTLFTPNIHEYERLFIKTSASNIVFRVKTCKDAMIALTEENRVKSNKPYYELVIGGQSNTITEIRKVQSGANAFANTLDILSCEQHRFFWISLTNEGVKGVSVGTGMVPGLQEITKLKDASLLDVTHVSFASWTQSTAWWEILANQDDFAELKSHNDDALGSYGISVVDINEVKFRVQACRSISVAISTIPNNFEVMAFEVVIGHDDNSAVIVRNGVGGTIIAEEHIDGLLHCNYFRTFWMTWANQSMTIGRGAEIGEDKILSIKNNLTLPFTSLSAHSGPDSNFLWQFSANSNYDFPPDEFPWPPNDTSTVYATTDKSIGISTTVIDTTKATSTDEPPTMGQSSTTRQSLETTVHTSTTASQSSFPSSSSPPTFSTTTHHQSTEVATEGDHNPGDGGGGLGAGAIVGIVFGVLIAIALIGGAGFFTIRKFKDFPEERVPFQGSFHNPIYGAEEADDSEI